MSNAAILIRVRTAMSIKKLTVFTANELPATGFVRLPAIVAPRGVFPVSKSTWWAGIAAGRYPRPVKLSERTSAWRVDDIRTLIARVEEDHDR